MAGPAHPDAMAPPVPGRTRTAPPQTPGSWWSSPRIRTYLAFDATGVIYLLLGFVVLRAIWALGEGPDEWSEVLRSFGQPLYVLFHVFSLLCVVFVAVRFFRLFPKAQPPKVGPLAPPPRPALHAMLYVVWAAITVGLAVILGGGIFR